MVVNAGLGRDFTLDDLTDPGLRLGRRRDRLLRHQQARASRTRTPTASSTASSTCARRRSACPTPDHAGKRVVVIGGGFTSMDCSRTSVRQGAGEVTLVYRRDMKDMPAADEVHEAIEEGVTRHLPGRPDRGSSPTRRPARSPASSSSGCSSGEPDASGRRRPEPAPGTEFTIPCDRVLLAIGQGPELDWLAQPGNEGPEATKQKRLKADAVTFSTGRPGVFGTGDVRIGAATVVEAIAEGRRAAYAVDAFLKGMDLDAIRTRQTLAEPQPEFLSIVPFTAEIKEPRYRMTALPAEERNHSYIEYELPYTPEAAMAESTRCLQCTCEAIGFCDLRRLGIEYGTTLKTLEPQYHQGAGYRSVTENRFTGINHDYIRDDSPRVHPARAVALHRLRALRQRLRRGRRRGLLRLHAHRLRHARDDAARHEPQRHPVRVVRPLRRDVPDRRADAQAAGPREVRGRREPLHPVRHLRRRVPVRRAARRRRHRARAHRPLRADHRPDGPRRHRPRDRGRPTSGASATGRPGRRPRAAIIDSGADAADAARRRSAGSRAADRQRVGNGHGNGHDHGHDHGAVAALGPGGHE